ncbi:IS4 family transposase [Thiorhodovibrio winogradskyi]|uniref:IS4 family transposase n=1 Tax=Thiorhodovibrio winogradskyi TaxID=77007 RepID=UPI002E2C1065|nr:IS4 family transposase [Thiorhodovibrio winogradskyi]
MPNFQAGGLRRGGMEGGLVTQRQAPPEEPPSLDSMIRMVASLGGFLNRKSDGVPGPKTLWIGLQRIPDFVRALEAYSSVGDSYG